MSILAIVLLILLGIVLLIIEFLLIPGITIAGIGGTLLIGAGVFMAYKTHGTIVGNYTLLGSFLFGVVTVYLSLKSKTWRKFMLSDNITGQSSESLTEEQVKTGDTGKTITRMNPIGNVMVNNLIIEAKSTTGFIPENTEVVVTKIVSSKIIVKPKNE